MSCLAQPYALKSVELALLTHGVLAYLVATLILNDILIIDLLPQLYVLIQIDRP